VLACADPVHALDAEPRRGGSRQAPDARHREDIDRPERPREPYVVQIEFIEAGKGWS
jgi:hypothetical protein